MGPLSKRGNLLSKTTKLPDLQASEVHLHAAGNPLYFASTCAISHPDWSQPQELHWRE